MLSFGAVTRWGVEGANGWGGTPRCSWSATATTCGTCARTGPPSRAQRRWRGKSDALDAERIARETLADPMLPLAFKRAGGDTGPDETTELLGLWQLARRSTLTSRQHLLTEAESLLAALPEPVRRVLPDTAAVRPRLAALPTGDALAAGDPADCLRLRLLREHRAAIAELDAREREITKELAGLVDRTGCTLGELRGLSTRSTVELLVEVGDVRRFTEGGFARFNGTAG